MSKGLEALKMFENLGYSLEKLYGGATLIYTNKFCETTITFHTNEYKGNRIHIHSNGNTYQDSGMITFAELKAINKQVEELGWEDDTQEQVSWINKVKESQKCQKV